MSEDTTYSLFFYRIQVIASPVCRLCHEQEDTMSHFLVYYLQKKIIWTIVLNHLFPTFNFASDNILQMLHRLSSPFHYQYVLTTPFTTTLATIVWNTLIFY